MYVLLKYNKDGTIVLATLITNGIKYYYTLDKSDSYLRPKALLRLASELSSIYKSATIINRLLYNIYSRLGG